MVSLHLCHDLLQPVLHTPARVSFQGAQHTSALPIFHLQGLHATSGEGLKSTHKVWQTRSLPICSCATPCPLPPTDTLKVEGLVAQSCPTLCDPRLLCPWNSLGKDTGVGGHSLLQGTDALATVKGSLSPPRTVRCGPGALPSAILPDDKASHLPSIPPPPSSVPITKMPSLEASLPPLPLGLRLPQRPPPLLQPQRLHSACCFLVCVPITLSGPPGLAPHLGFLIRSPA